jgi:hypothetical protein
VSGLPTARHLHNSAPCAARPPRAASRATRQGAAVFTGRHGRLRRLFPLTARRPAAAFESPLPAPAGVAAQPPRRFMRRASVHGLYPAPRPSWILEGRTVDPITTPGSLPFGVLRPFRWGVKGPPPSVGTVETRCAAPTLDLRAQPVTHRVRVHPGEQRFALERRDRMRQPPRRTPGDTGARVVAEATAGVEIARSRPHSSRSSGRGAAARGRRLAL